MSSGLLHRFRGPLTDRYPAAVALVLLALTPYLVLSTALGPVQQLIAKDLGMTARSLQLTTGMSNAAYAVGAVLAVQCTSKLRPRRMLLVYAALFIAGSVLAAWSPVAGVFIAGHVVQGLATGLLLIASVPPLVLSWGTDKLRSTAVVMNLGIFGAVALGPVIGGAVASSGSWRWLLWVVVAMAIGALTFALATFEDAEPQDPSAPWDGVALTLATAGCGAAFFGVSELLDRRLTDAIVGVPILGGVLLLVALVVFEWRKENPLIPVRQLAHTVPVAAIVIAMTAGAASVALVQLVGTAQEARGAAPTHTSLLFVPEFVMALVSAVLFGRLFFTRWTALLALSGLAVLVGAAAVLTGVAGGGDGLVLLGVALTGFGVGASVSPSLFLAGFSLRSPQLPRVFAFVELLRGAAAFLVGPLLVKLAHSAGSAPADGIRTAMWVTLALVAAGLIAASAVALLGRARLHEPDIDAWLAGDTPAIPSERLGHLVRSDDEDRADRFARDPDRERPRDRVR